MSDIVRLAPPPTLTRDEIRLRLRRVASLLEAIESGELLAALPEGALAQANHLAALELLSIVEVEIGALSRELA